MGGCAKSIKVRDMWVDRSTLGPRIGTEALNYMYFLRKIDQTLVNTNKFSPAAQKNPIGADPAGEGGLMSCQSFV